jgi:putative ATPase
MCGFVRSLTQSPQRVHPHDFDEGVAEQDYLPPALKGRRWYSPSPFGHEKEIARRMEWWRKVLAERSAHQEQRDS